MSARTAFASERHKNRQSWPLAGIDVQREQFADIDLSHSSFLLLWLNTHATFA
jgi:hypothetical protein